MAALSRPNGQLVPTWVLVLVALVATLGWGATLMVVLAVPSNEGARAIFPSVNIAFGAIISGVFAVGILGKRNGRRNGTTE